MIRLANKNDKEQICKLLNEMQDFLGQGKVQTSENQIFDQHIDDKNLKFFVAEEDSHLIALAVFHILPDFRHNNYRGLIKNMFVTENKRSQGFGTQILETVKSYCKENNIKVFTLQTGLELKDAHEFYEKNGGIFNEKSYLFKIN